MIDLTTTPWTVRRVAGPDGTPVGDAPIPATVPGCAHLDLLAAGLIAEPYEADNAEACQWVGRCDWAYATHFDLPAGAGPFEVVAESLQGSAEVVVNGVAVARHRTQHAPLRADVTAALRAGRNEVVIRFASPLREFERLERERGPFPVAMPGVEPSVHLRQMACGFGWDWAPPLATVGVVGPVALRPTGAPHLRGLRAIVESATEGRATVRAVADVGGPAVEGVGCVLELRDPAGAVVATATGPDATLTVDRPARWWPRGYGGQPLYTLAARLTRGGETLDELTRRVGLRTVAIDATPDATGSAFTVVVNGTPVFAKGMNWTPLDQLLPRITDDAIRRSVADATDAGANMLRVWGGGRYEPDAFYDACDAAGVLVWHDFMFACGMYPEAAIGEGVEAEARHQVARLSGRACVALFCGGNETVWFHQVRPAWRDAVGESGWGDGLYFGLLPRVVADLAPATPYVANSPFGAGPESPADDPGHGPQHLWDAWNREPAEAYRRTVPRFASEFGFCGPATYATLDAAIGLAGRTPRDPLVRDRLKAVNGTGKLDARLAEVFGPAAADFDLDRWLAAGQMMQAWAVETGIDWFRANAPTCAGSLLWQLHDCWPATSWSLVDSGGRRKPAWHAARAAMADRRLSFQPRGGALHLVAVNDAPDPMRQRATVRRHDFSGDALAECELRVDAPPRSVQWLPVPDLVAVTDDPARTLLRCGEATWWFAPHHALDLPPASLDVDAVARGDGYRVRVTAGAIARAACLFPDRLDPAATVDSALVTLLPGESHTFRVASARTLARRDLARWPVLATANDLPPARAAADLAAHRAG